MRLPDVLIVGGGVIGCGTAYELARRGLRIALLERAGLCAGASGANGALVWPQAMKSGPALDLSMASARIFSTLGDELGTDIEYERPGGIIAVDDDGRLDEITRFVAGQAQVGLPAELIDGDEARRREPCINPRLHAAVYAPLGGKVNPFRLTLGYARAARERGAELHPGVAASALVRRGSRIVGVMTDAGVREAGLVVLAAGTWSAELAATAAVALPVTPRQGMMVVTERAPFALRHVLKPIKNDADVWAFSQPWPPDAPGKPGYDPNLPPGKGMALAQTASGNVITGSTSRFVGMDVRPTAEGVQYILTNAARVVPGLARLRVLRAWAGLRPYTPDGLPLLGRAPDVEGLVLATGHDGGGIGVAPMTARLVAALVTASPAELPLAPFDPHRFHLS